jgi:hypothetical protein
MYAKKATRQTQVDMSIKENNNIILNVDVP